MILRHFQPHFNEVCFRNVINQPDIIERFDNAVNKVVTGPCSKNRCLFKNFHLCHFNSCHFQRKVQSIIDKHSSPFFSYFVHCILHPTIDSLPKKGYFYFHLFNVSLPFIDLST